MNFKDIHIRDPFVLVDGGKYYMYGSRGQEAWGHCTGLDVYVSEDLENWSEAIEVFKPPVDFWADQNFWAPEVHAYKGAYYMLVSFKSDTCCRGTQILKSESPVGPFQLHSDGPVTPKEWECLDGTLFIETDGKPYMVFCHEWLQVNDGEMCAIELTEDLSASVGEPVVLFKGSEPVWATGLNEDLKNSYVTDGPFLYRTQKGTLLMLWSSFAQGAYCEGIAYSDNGRLTGKWTHDERLLFGADGGHGMIFTTLEGEMKFIFHQPNNSPEERPQMVSLKEIGDSIYKV